MALAPLATLTRLRRLHLRHCRHVSDAAVRAVAAALPHLQVGVVAPCKEGLGGFRVVGFLGLTLKPHLQVVVSPIMGLRG